MFEHVLHRLPRLNKLLRRHKSKSATIKLIKKFYAEERDVNTKTKNTSKKIVLSRNSSSPPSSALKKYAIPLEQVEKHYQDWLNHLPESEKELQVIINNGGVKTPSEKKFLVSTSLPGSSQRLGGINMVYDAKSSEDYIELAKKRIKEQLYSSKEDLGNRFKSVEEIIDNQEFKNEYKGFYGKPLVFKDNHLQEITDTQDLNVFISFGIDSSDNVKTVTGGIKKLNEFLFNLEKSEDLLAAGINECVIWPEADRLERYKRGLLYYFEERYVDQYAFAFVDKYLIPRLFKPEPFGPLLFVGYSLGARDNAIYINAFKSRLANDLMVSPYVIDSFMRKIFKINIGAAVVWDSPSPAYNPFSLNFLSLNDMGILKSESFFNAVFYNSTLAEKPYSLLYRTPSSARPPVSRQIDQIHYQLPREFLVTLGADVIPGECKDSKGKMHLNPLGHSPMHYYEGIKKSPAHKYLKLPFYFLDDSRTAAEAGSLRKAVIEECQSYDSLEKIPSSKEISWREKHLANYMEAQDKLKKSTANQSDSSKTKSHIIENNASFFKNPVAEKNTAVKSEVTPLNTTHKPLK